jgi:hypothetical protein
MIQKRGGDMQQRFGVIAAVVLLVTSAAWAQDAAPPSLMDQLSAQYKLVKTGTDGGGLTIIEPGTVLAIQKGGILGVEPATAVVCPAKFENGELKRPNVICAAMVKSSSRFFTVGEKVYITKIEVNDAKGQISLRLLDCDSCNGSQDPAYYKSQVVFQFPKGSLDSGSVSKIEDTIAQLFTIDESGGQQQAQGDQGEQNQGGPPQGQPQAQPPQNIGIGQTIDQVLAAWGQPQKIVNLGVKQIYIYPDAKVTFVNGKVTDAQ